MTVIAHLAAGVALRVALSAVAGGFRAFVKQDNLGRLLVLLHADFGDRADLERDAFYAWRADRDLEADLRAVLGGLPPSDDHIARLADSIEPHLVRTDIGRQALAREISGAAFQAAPFAADGGSEAIALVVGRVEGGHDEILKALKELRDPETAPVSNLAQALVAGPLEHAGVAENVTEAEAEAQAGEYATAAESLLEVSETLNSQGLQLAAETIRQRAAGYLAAAGQADRAADVLSQVIWERLDRGAATLASLDLSALRDLLAPEQAWVAGGLDARAHWPEGGEAALTALAVAATESTGREDQLAWVSVHSDLLTLHNKWPEVLAATADARAGALADGYRLSIELDALDALEQGDIADPEPGWLELLRWADQTGSLESRAIAWQRRGVVMAKREAVDEAIDAFRRAMAAWAGIPGYEEQAADALFSAQAAALANARRPRDLELRPLAWATRGTTQAPVGTAERLEHEAMSKRLAGKLPDALAGYWMALAIHGRVGSLQGLLDTSARLAELYAHAGEPGIATTLYLSAGQAKEAAKTANLLDGEALAEHLPIETSRWQRAAAYHVIGEVGRRLPAPYVGANAERVLDEAEQEPDGFYAPQPHSTAKRALATISLSVPVELRDRTFARLEAELQNPFPDQWKAAALALVLATNVGYTDGRKLLTGRFIEDPFNSGISPAWIAEQASVDDEIVEMLRAAALADNEGSLEALAHAELIEGPELKRLCSKVAEGAAELVTIEEQELPDGGTSSSVKMRINLSRPGVIARFAGPAARAAFLERTLEIVQENREPESNRAAAAGALFNLAPSLTSEQAQRVADALGPLALGEYATSHWDMDSTHPLSRFQVSMQTPTELRGSAIGTLAQLSSKHAGLTGLDLEEIMVLAVRDSSALVVAAAFESAARLPELPLPVSLETGLLHSDAEVARQALIAWAVRRNDLPPNEIVDRLQANPSVNLRLQLLILASEDRPGGNALLEELSESDPDAYVRAKSELAMGKESADS